MQNGRWTKRNGPAVEHKQKRKSLQGAEAGA